ncbi:kinase/pyrophosphorylase [Paenibacillus sp. GSMTC-2017]|uniref:pyruvate, water dikinase regulatory protein n=1 Tax=Paenibacillus sp. GSMTC-2017 TaxID=2794350 RepID=UPI0018D65C70|nr:pyruvate, water dikinase regulatory protein [Paenibacillus sp. GSMTC-2017]MBH5318307.1 kinase/pyrophosphorylase [Paenibacillus sp. GSMTC-2017]
MLTKQQYLVICSDSIGETAEAVAQATIRQFNSRDVIVKRYSNIRTEEEVQSIVKETAALGGLVAYTLVQPELREAMKNESMRMGIRAVDIMGPMMQAFVDTYGYAPKRQPGLLHEMNEDYFRRIEAIEFAVKFDDGRDPRGMLQAQVVLIGVSRTSKTPLSIYLAHKGIKTANLPIIPEVKLPSELFKIKSGRIFGLTMDAEHILNIRTERLKVLGLPEGSQYATFQRIIDELEYGQSLMKQLGCTVINVTNKAIEETAGIIIDHL